MWPSLVRDQTLLAVLMRERHLTHLVLKRPAASNFCNSLHQCGAFKDREGIVTNFQRKIRDGFLLKSEPVRRTSQLAQKLLSRGINSLSLCQNTFLFNLPFGCQGTFKPTVTATTPLFCIFSQRSEYTSCCREISLVINCCAIPRSVQLMNSRAATHTKKL